jgi:Protein of unknown function (DUF2283).
LTTPPKKEYQVNREPGIVFDRPEPGYYGTSIIMLRIRKRREGEKTAYSKEVAPGWVVDYDADDKPIEIEVLNSSAFPNEILDLLPAEFIKVET